MLHFMALGWLKKEEEDGKKDDTLVLLLIACTNFSEFSDD